MDYDRLWNGNKGEFVRAYCSEQFKNIYPRTIKFMPELWSKAIGIYRDFANNELHNEDGSLNYSEDELREDIKNSLREGRPIIRSLYRHRMDNINDGSKSTNSGQDYFST